MDLIQNGPWTRRAEMGRLATFLHPKVEDHEKQLTWSNTAFQRCNLWIWESGVGIFTLQTLVDMVCQHASTQILGQNLYWIWHKRPLTSSDCLTCGSAMCWCPAKHCKHRIAIRLVFDHIWDVLVFASCKHASSLVHNKSSTTQHDIYAGQYHKPRGDTSVKPIVEFTSICGEQKEDWNEPHLLCFPGCGFF